MSADSDRQKAVAKKAFSMAVVIGVVCAIYFGGSAVNKALKGMRDGMRSVPLEIGIPVFLLISCARKLCPPVYFMCPVGTLLAMYCVDKGGVVRGAMIYQLLKLQDVVFFKVIQIYFTSAATRTVEGTSNPNPQAKCSVELSPTFREGFVALDDTWRHHFQGRSRLFQAGTIVALATTM
jgi:hypothetical protein